MLTTIKNGTINIVHIPLNLLDSHPNNPRPWSEKYQDFVYEEKVDRLIHDIFLYGYDESEPILVRQIEGRYQILKGHHRRMAAQVLGVETIAAVIKDVDDKTAGVLLRRMQGQEVDSWSKRRHAYHYCVMAPESERMSVKDYAEAHGDRPATVSTWLREYKVRLALELIFSSEDLEKISAKVARDISIVPEDCWTWFARLLIDKEVPEARRRQVVTALKDFIIPERYQAWLPLGKWREAIASEILQFGESEIPSLLQRCCETAEALRQSLDRQREVWKIVENEPLKLIIDLRARFVRRLESCPLSVDAVHEAYDAIALEMKEADRAYRHWLTEQQSEEERKAECDRLAQLELERVREYRPKGVLDDRTLEPLFDVRYNAAFLHIRSPETAWSDLLKAQDRLQETANLVVICTQESLLSTFLAIGKMSVVILDQLVWHKPSTEFKNSGRYAEDYQPILVLCKMGIISYFDGRGHNKTTISIPLPQDEKLKWCDNQIPQALAQILIDKYVPKDGTILEMGSTCGTIAATAKSMARKATFTTSDEVTLNRILDRCDRVALPENVIGPVHSQHILSR